MLRTIVTKAEYARLKNREPSSVSNWIAEGKISKSALIGEGVRAQIWVEQADADLARHLDVSQQLAQDNPILPDVGAPPPADQVAEADNVSLLAAARATKDADLQRRLAAEATMAEQAAIAAIRKNAIEDGRWVDAAVAAKQFGGELARTISDIETFLSSTLARSVAEAHGLDWKTLSVEFRQGFRKFRAEVADGSKAERERLEGVLADAAE